MSTYDLDITKEHCPMTFVKTKLKLETLVSGDTLAVTLKEGEPLSNVPKSVTEQGYEVLSIEALEEPGVHRVTILKP